MAITVEQFGKALIKHISSSASAHGGYGYVLTSNLMSWVQMSLVPEGAVQDFPRMIYRRAADGSQEDYTVQSNEELLARLEQGWRREPLPAPVGYPQNWVEIDRSRGSDYRRVLLRTARDEEIFRRVVDLTNWVRDDKYELAGRGVFLADLETEYKERLKRLVDADALEFVETGSDNVGHEDSGADEPNRGAKSAELD